jgi:hypothetical protein
VVRDIIKTYYDKKNKKEQGQYTVELEHHNLDGEASPAVADSVSAAIVPQLAPQVALKRKSLATTPAVAHAARSTAPVAPAAGQAKAVAPH